MLLALFLYAFLSNVALSVVPHEPVVVWYGQHTGVWPTALVATAGTVAASWFDHRAFSNLIQRWAPANERSPAWLALVRRQFRRAPFAVIALSGLSPLPFFPFKALAFAERYPLVRYLGAVTVGRLPRYLLLAWVGHTLQIPAWVFIALSVVLLFPILKRITWQRQSVN